MRTIEEIRNLVAQEQGYANWVDLWWNAAPSIKIQAVDIAISNYAFESRQQLLQEIKKTLLYFPEALDLIGETEYRTYPKEENKRCNNTG